jgi:hypothetical protein
MIRTTDNRKLTIYLIILAYLNVLIFSEIKNKKIFNHQTVSVANVIIRTALGKIFIETALCMKMGVMAKMPINGDVKIATLKSLLIFISCFIIKQN